MYGARKGRLREKKGKDVVGMGDIMGLVCCLSCKGELEG